MIGFGNEFPYSDFHQLNLDWILKKVKSDSDKLNNTLDHIQDYVDDSVSRAMLGAVYDEENNALAIEASNTVYDAVHYIDDNTLNIVEKE